jgi:DNA-binding response OmpR family regulator
MAAKKAKTSSTLKKQNAKRAPKILLAEDDAFISRAYRDGLGRAGFDIVYAADGVEALKKIREDIPDLVLLDIIMPFKNGFEVLAEIKGDAKLKDIPVIILSNLGQESDIEKGRSLGAADYFIKANYSLREVIEKVKEHLDKMKI